MKIEVWSDFVCPFCYLGKRRLEQALTQLLPSQSGVEVIYKSFELDPNAKRDGNPNVHDMLSQKYGMTREQAIANTNNITQQAKEAGLDYDFDGMIQTNTFDAHRLTHYAASKGKLEELTERLLKAHFTDGLHLGQHETLADMAEEVGLDRAESLQVLASDQYAENVRKDEQEATALGAKGVPFFVINRKYAIYGAQPVEMFVETLNKVRQEEEPLTVVGDDMTGDACVDESCIVPEDKP